MRQVVLDTETTGLDPAVDRIAEIACVEIVDRKIGGFWHTFVRPPVRVHPDAAKVHGLSDEFLSDKPRFSEIEKPLLEFLQDADEVLIHNAPFDVQFLSAEINGGGFDKTRKVVDTLAMARRIRGHRLNNLDSLAKFYGIENKRDGQHSALVDAELLARIYLAMTAGQLTMAIDRAPERDRTIFPLAVPERKELRVFVTPEQLAIHAEFCKAHKIPVF